jgi:hypothetical protein
MTAAWASDPDPVIQTVLHAFEGHGHQTIDAFLMSLRLAPLDPADRSQVLVTLPNDDVRLSRSQIEKIAAAERILNYSGRKGAIAVRPIIVDAALVGSTSGRWCLRPLGRWTFECGGVRRTRGSRSGA